MNTIAIDPERIGVYGHSFGAVTAGKAALSDPRIRAVAGLAAPLANPLFPGVEMKDISVPVLLVLAEEDNSILEFGNDFIRQGFEAANTPAWLVSIADAGHWSISDVCGLTSAFSAGCGEGIRHSKGNEGQSFTYLSSVEGIAIAQRHLTTFMLRFVSMTITAEAAQLPPEPGVEVRVR